MDVLFLSRALPEGIRQSEEIVRIEVREADVVGPAGRKRKVPVNIKIQELVEVLDPDVAAEFHRMISDNLGEVVRKLQGVSGLRQFAFGVVSDDETAGDADEGNALASARFGVIPNEAPGVIPALVYAVGVS